MQFLPRIFGRSASDDAVSRSGVKKREEEEKEREREEKVSL